MAWGIFHPRTNFGQSIDEVLKVSIPRLLDCVKEIHTAGNPVFLRPKICAKATLLDSLFDLFEMALEIQGVTS
jgi:hypothetical protein